MIGDVIMPDHFHLTYRASPPRVAPRQHRTLLWRWSFGVCCTAIVGVITANVNIRAATAPAVSTAAITPVGSVFSPLVDSVLVDPELMVGTLPNGMRYYIRVNKLPAKRANLWLAVDAGSIQEDPDQLGFAHFLEHMAFNGTKHFPGNSLIDVIEQTGMTFGADLNASTNFDETVYQLTIPTDDSKIFSQGLQIVEDWANGGITMDSAAVVGERGVVMGEWRMRLPDTASKRLQNDMLTRTFGKGSKYLDRFPIGTPESLEGATAAPIQRFYKDWYRPDRMAIIAVGDFDAAMVKKEIIKRFGRIPKPSASARSFTRQPVISSSSTVVHVIRDRVNPQVELTWTVPEASHTPEAAMRQALLERITFPAIQRTLTKLSKQERRPFAGGAIGRSTGMARPLPSQYLVRLAAAPDSLTNGLAVLLTEVERVARYGIPGAELEAQKAILLRQFESAADGQDALPSRSITERYSRHFLTGKGQLWGAAQALTLARRLLPTITSNDVAAFVREWHNPAGRVVTFQTPIANGVRPVTEVDVLAVLDSVTSTQFTATPASAPALASSTGTKASTSILATPPTPGTIIKEEQATLAGVTTWTLSNGARVVFKATKNNPDGLTLQAYSRGGHTRLPDSLFFTPGRLVGMLMTASGGLGDKDHEQLTNELGTTGLKEFRVDLNAFDEEIALTGSPRELDMLFQLLYAQFTNPTVDTTALAEWRRTGGGTLRMIPNDRLALQMGQHRRLAPPQAVNVPFIDLAQAMRVYHDRFGDASDFTFYIVGAATAQQVKQLVEQYLASLPSTHRTTRETARDLKIKLPNQRVVREMRSPNLSAERAQAQFVFNGLVPSSPAEYLIEHRRLMAVSQILGDRLRNRLREDMAVTYSASAPVQFYRTPEERYCLVISFLTDPSVIDSSVTAVWEEINRLRDNGPTAGELEIAATIQRRQAENARQSNLWWVSQLQNFETLNIPFDKLGLVAQPPLTAQEVQSAANKYLSKDIYTQMTILPTLETLAKKKMQADSTRDSTSTSTNLNQIH